MKIEMAKASKLDFMFVGKYKFLSNLISFFKQISMRLVLESNKVKTGLVFIQE